MSYPNVSFWGWGGIAGNFRWPGLFAITRPPSERWMASKSLPYRQSKNPNNNKNWIWNCDPFLGIWSWWTKIIICTWFFFQSELAEVLSVLLSLVQMSLNLFSVLPPFFLTFYHNTIFEIEKLNDLKYVYYIGADFVFMGKAFMGQNMHWDKCKTIFLSLWKNRG